MSVAARKRPYRERRAEGRAVLHIEVDLFEITELLVEAGLLRQWDDHDRAKIEEATAQLLKTMMREGRVPS